MSQIRLLLSTGEEGKTGSELSPKAVHTVWIINTCSTLQARERCTPIGPGLLGCLCDDPDKWAKSSG